MTALGELPAPPTWTAPAPRDVIFTFSYVSWEGSRRRGANMAQDRLATRLLDEPRVRRLMIVNPFRSLPRRLARQGLRRPAGPASTDVTLHEPLRLRRDDPTSLRAVEAAYRGYDARLRRAAARAGMVEPAVITMHPLVAGFAPLEWAGPVTFYCTDDWTVAPAYRRWSHLYEEAYARVRASARGVCAVSQPIVERMSPTGPHRVVPNGIEVAEWRSPGVAPEWFRSLPRPRLLYLGTLDDRLDLGVIEALSAANPGGTIVLVGTAGVLDVVRRLRALPRVHVVERQARQAIPGLTAAADVCLIPHRRTAFTEAMSPLKAYEYLAAGRPTVAADLPPLRGIDDRLRLVSSGDDWPAAVAAALKRGPTPEDERLAFLKRNRWADRHDQVLALSLR